MSPGLPCGHQGPKHVGHFLMLSPGDKQGTRLEMEQSGLKPALIYGILALKGNGFTYCVIMSDPHELL